jgi:hypothetical protein
MRCRTRVGRSHVRQGGRLSDPISRIARRSPLPNFSSGSSTVLCRLPATGVSCAIYAMVRAGLDVAETGSVLLEATEFSLNNSATMAESRYARTRTILPPSKKTIQQ